MTKRQEKRKSRLTTTMTTMVALADVAIVRLDDHDDGGDDRMAESVVDVVRWPTKQAKVVDEKHQETMNDYLVSLAVSASHVVGFAGFHL